MRILHSGCIYVIGCCWHHALVCKRSVACYVISYHTAAATRQVCGSWSNATDGAVSVLGALLHGLIVFIVDNWQASCSNIVVINESFLAAHHPVLLVSFCRWSGRSPTHTLSTAFACCVGHHRRGIGFVVDGKCLRYWELVANVGSQGQGCVIVLHFSHASWVHIWLRHFLLSCVIILHFDRVKCAHCMCNSNQHYWIFVPFDKFQFCASWFS